MQYVQVQKKEKTSDDLQRSWTWRWIAVGLLSPSAQSLQQPRWRHHHISSASRHYVRCRAAQLYTRITVQGRSYLPILYSGLRHLASELTIWSELGIWVGFGTKIKVPGGTRLEVWGANYVFTSPGWFAQLTETFLLKTGILKKLRWSCFTTHTNCIQFKFKNAKLKYVSGALFSYCRGSVNFLGETKPLWLRLLYLQKFFDNRRLLDYVSAASCVLANEKRQQPMAVWSL